MCHPSRPPIPEECEVNHLHAEAVKKRKEAAEEAAERKRKRKAKHDKASKIARAEGKPRPFEVHGPAFSLDLWWG